jgi:protein SCO1/2
MRITLLLSTLLVAMLSACTPKDRTFDVKGHVVGFGDNPRTVIVDHEPVPNFMPRMTMPFRTLPGDSVTFLRNGDAVAFRMIVTKDSTYILDLRRIADSELETNEMPTAVLPASAAPMVTVGDRVPPASLINENGETFTLTSFQGKALALTFIYTRCPLPDFCPLLTTKFGQIERLAGSQFGDRAALLSITMDPEYDTPEVMRSYKRRSTRDGKNWTFATGSSRQIETVSRLFGLYREGASGMWDHNIVVILIGPDGRIAETWRSQDWTAEDIVASMERALETL